MPCTVRYSSPPLITPPPSEPQRQDTRSKGKGGTRPPPLPLPQHPQHTQTPNVATTGIASKLKEAGYRTAMVGKWDAGMATLEQTPYGRGYDEWFGYFQHANDYWEKG